MIRCSERCTDGCDCGAAEMNDETRPLSREALLDLCAAAARELGRFGTTKGTRERLINDLEEAVNRG